MMDLEMILRPLKKPKCSYKNSDRLDLDYATRGHDKT
jgi:hypothetical protein